MEQEKGLYRIRIVTHAEGEERVFSAPGALLESGEGFTFSYETEGEPTELKLSGGRLIMARRGRSELYCIFENGKAGEMTMALGGLSAKIPLHTHRLEILPSRGIFEAELEYDLLFGNSFSHYLLHICILSEAS